MYQANNWSAKKIPSCSNLALFTEQFSFSMLILMLRPFKFCVPNIFPLRPTSIYKNNLFLKIFGRKFGFRGPFTEALT